MIEVSHLSMQYPSGKGVFDVTFRVNSGTVAGYLGPNGAGKTTTIRQLMGFIKPDSGSCTIDGLDCFTKAPEIQKRVAYIAGEVAFLEGVTGQEYLKLIAEIRGLRDLARQKQLLEMFELSLKGPIKKYSKGMKQKLAIVSAFMHSPDVLILDEPTSGLDPLMQTRFVELLLEEKRRGRTILLSSHMFEEVERTCDNVLIIKDGRIVANSNVETLKSNRRKCFVIGVKDMPKALECLIAAGFSASSCGDKIEARVTGEQTSAFVALLSTLSVQSLDMKHQSLEDVFMDFYAKGEA